MLKYIYESEDEIPEGLKEHYTEDGGKFVLQCEGAVPKKRLDEFRQTNTELKTRLEAFDGIDPEEYAKMLKERGDWEAGNAKTKEEIEEQVEKRTKALKEEGEKKIAELEATTATQRAKLEKLQIDAAVIDAATEIGLKTTAHDDIVSRARGTWKLDEDGKPVAMDGDEKLYGPGGDPMSMAEWSAKLAKDAPHLFEENKGGGSGGGGKGGGTGDEVNPWNEKTFNLTEQGKMLRADPDKAKRMAAAAGRPIK